MPSTWTFTQVDNLHSRLNEHADAIIDISRAHNNLVANVDRAINAVGDLAQPTTTTEMNARIGSTIDSIHREFGENAAAAIDRDIQYYRRLGVPPEIGKIREHLECTNDEFKKREQVFGSRMATATDEPVTRLNEYFQNAVTELTLRVGHLNARCDYDEVLKDQFVADLFMRSHSQSARLDQIDGSASERATVQLYQESIDKARAEALLLNSPTANQVLADFLSEMAPLRDASSTSAGASITMLAKILGNSDAALLSILMRMAHGFDKRVDRLESELQMDDASVSGANSSPQAVLTGCNESSVASTGSAAPGVLNRYLSAALSLIGARDTVGTEEASANASTRLVLHAAPSTKGAKVARMHDVEQIIGPVTQGISELRGSVASIQEDQAISSTLAHDVKVTGGAIADLRKELNRMNISVEKNQVGATINDSKLRVILDKVETLEQANKTNAATAQQLAKRIVQVEGSVELFDVRLRALERTRS